MKSKSLNRIIYKLTVEDLQTVALEILDRNLTETEISLIENEISDYIDWFDAISNAIFNKIKK